MGKSPVKDILKSHEIPIKYPLNQPFHGISWENPSKLTMENHHFYPLVT
jgi:hypothetical protein